MVLMGERLSSRFMKKRSVQFASEYLHRWGAWVIVLTRFTPIVRAPVYLAVGVSRFGVLRFFQTDGLAACVQVPLLLYLGKTIGGSNETVGAAVRTMGWIAGGLLVLTLLFTVLVDKSRKATNFS